MYSYKPTADEQAEDVVNQKNIKSIVIMKLGE